MNVVLGQVGLAEQPKQDYHGLIKSLMAQEDIHPSWNWSDEKSTHWSPHGKAIPARTSCQLSGSARPLPPDCVLALSYQAAFL